MARRGRFIVDAGIGVALVGSIAALGIAGPASPAPVAAPRDTFTHVDALLADSGLHVQPAHVPAGQVEFSVVDHRSARGDAITLRSTPPGIVIGAGTTVVPVRTLGNYALRADDAPNATGAPLAVDVPALGAPREPVHQLTLRVDDHTIVAPRREARFEEPLVAPVTAPGPGVPWTIVAPGATNIVFENHGRGIDHCSVDGGAPVTVGARGSARITATIGGAHTTVISCASPGSGALRFDVRPS